MPEPPQITGFSSLPTPFLQVMVAWARAERHLSCGSCPATCGRYCRHPLALIESAVRLVPI